MLVVETIAKIRRYFFVEGKRIKQISRELRISRNTVRGVIRSEAVQAGRALLGKEGILSPLIKQLTEAALEGEIASHLSEGTEITRRNGKSDLIIKSLNGNFKLSSPRDRTGSFSPQLIKKHQTTLSDEIEQKTLVSCHHCKVV